MNSKFMFSSARFSISVTKFVLVVNYENMYKVIRLKLFKGLKLCRRNSATTRALDVAEILQPLMQWVQQKFCYYSYTGCGRNSATAHTLGVAEILRHNFSPLNNFKRFVCVMNRAQIYHLNLALTFIAITREINSQLSNESLRPSTIQRKNAKLTESQILINISTNVYNRELCYMCISIKRAKISFQKK